jgi:hypothetical protein
MRLRGWPQAVRLKLPDDPRLPSMEHAPLEVFSEPLTRTDDSTPPPN